jgi:DNA repair protein RadC
MATLIREIPQHDRPRERLERHGAQALTDAELLAVLLRTGSRGVSAVQLGEELLRRFGGLDELGKRSVSEIASVHGMGKAKAVLLKAAFALHERVTDHKIHNQPLDTSDHIHQWISQKVRFLNVEVLYGLALDSKLRLISYYEISSGLLNQTLVHAREAFREAIAVSAAHLVLVHNHPSGDPKPSPDDIRVTRDLVEAGKLIGIPIIDHLIIGSPSVTHPSGYVSLKKMGII